MKVAVLQAVYGGYDDLPEWPAQSVPYERIVATDDVATRAELHGVRFVLEPRPHLHPRMAAKVPKCLPWEYTDADVIIWCDGSVLPTDARFVEYMIAQSEGADVAWFAHPMRTRIDDEADASAWMAKYQGQDVYGQVKHYYERGYTDVGLWASGLAVWRHPHSDHVQRFGRHWLLEQAMWTYQDQLSLGWSLWWNSGVTVHTIPGNLFDPTPCHFTLRPHRRDD